MWSIDNIKANINQDNLVTLNIEVSVGELNQVSMLGDFHVLRKALESALFYQIKDGHIDLAQQTLKEINQIFFLEAIGMVNGSLVMQNGRLTGLDEKVQYINVSQSGEMDEVDEEGNLLISCSVCLKNFDEGQVNIIDYDLDLCVNCEKDYLAELKKSVPANGGVTQ